MGDSCIYCSDFNGVLGGFLKAAVLISYFPDQEILNKTLNSLVRQVDRLFWVDNGTEEELPHETAGDNVVFIGLKNNIGIAAAQNIGINAAIRDGAEFVILSDQDTYFPNDCVDTLIKTFSRWPEAAAVVPQFRDKNKKTADGFILHNTSWFSSTQVSAGDHQLFQAIASGKVLRVSALGAVGLMDESLFIDWVDLEWCWRARDKGFSVVGNASVTIEHTLGDFAKDLGFREVNLRSSQRHYYITRNAFYLALRSPYLSLFHRVILFLRSLRYLLAFPIMARPRLSNLIAVCQAFYHGLSGNVGPRWK